MYSLKLEKSMSDCFHILHVDLDVWEDSRKQDVPNLIIEGHFPAPPG